MAAIKVLDVSGPPGLPNLLGGDSELSVATAISALRFSPDGQLKVGNGEDFFPQNGRWNFNNNQIHDVLDLMRRGEGLRFEDVMILDQSVFFGMGDHHDRHRDMRLDVDNMSYEMRASLFLSSSR